MSVHDSLEKINPVKDREGSQRPSVFNGVKQFLESDKGKDVLIVIIVILVGFGSFSLGRLSKGGQNPGIEIEYTDETLPKIENQEASVISSITSSSLLQNTEIENPTGKTFFASNRGTKYYSVGCSAGKTIKQENRVYRSE